MYLTHARACMCAQAVSHPQEMFSASLVFASGQTHMHVAQDRLRTDSFDEQGLNIYLAFQWQCAERGRGCENVCLTNSGGFCLSAGPGYLHERNVKEFFTSLFCFVFLFCFPSERAFLALVKGSWLTVPENESPLFAGTGTVGANMPSQSLLGEGTPCKPCSDPGDSYLLPTGPVPSVSPALSWTDLGTSRMAIPHILAGPGCSLFGASPFAKSLSLLRTLGS